MVRKRDVRLVWGGVSEECWGGETYAAEEMPDEYYEGFFGAVLGGGGGVEGLEGVGGAGCVEDGEVADAREVCGRWLLR